MSVAAPDALSGGNGGMCLFPSVLLAGRLLQTATLAGESSQVGLWLGGGGPLCPPVGRAEVSEPRGCACPALHHCQGRDQALLHPLAMPHGLFESSSLSLCEA